MHNFARTKIIRASWIGNIVLWNYVYSYSAGLIFVTGKWKKLSRLLIGRDVTAFCCAKKKSTYETFSLFTYSRFCGSAVFDPYVLLPKASLMSEYVRHKYRSKFAEVRFFLLFPNFNRRSTLELLYYHSAHGAGFVTEKFPLSILCIDDL